MRRNDEISMFTNETIRQLSFQVDVYIEFKDYNRILIELELGLIFILRVAALLSIRRINVYEVPPAN
jgi:hypothetical protein